MNDTNWTEIKSDTEGSDFPQSWDFENERTLIGVLTEIKTGVGKHKSTVYTIEKEDGTKLSVWGSTVLASRMGNLNVGEEVKIEYLGDKPTDKGKPYHDFSVFHRETEKT